MDTALEALFKAMMNHGWFIRTDGEVEANTGFFGYVTNTEAELEGIYDGFDDVVTAYGKPKTEDIVGAFFASIDSDGIIHITRTETDKEAKRLFFETVERYNKWCEATDV